MPALVFLTKAYVPTHQRRLKNGNMITVQAYYDKRIKKAAQHAPDHNHDVSHLSEADKAKFSNMHKEQHVAHYYEAHALKRRLESEKQLLATLERSAKRHEEAGDKKSVTAVHNKIIKIKQLIMRHEKMLAHAMAITEGIGKMKHGLVPGSGELKDDADKQHAHYVGKLGERFSNADMTKHLNNVIHEMDKSGWKTIGASGTKSINKQQYSFGIDYKSDSNGSIVSAKINAYEDERVSNFPSPGQGIKSTKIIEFDVKTSLRPIDIANKINKAVDEKANSSGKPNSSDEPVTVQQAGESKGFKIPENPANAKPETKPVSPNAGANTEGTTAAAGHGAGKQAIIEHTTKKGKVIRGVVRTDLTQAQAKAIDEYTFRKDGGYFIREKHIDVANKLDQAKEKGVITAEQHKEAKQALASGGESAAVQALQNTVDPAIKRKAQADKLRKVADNLLEKSQAAQNQDRNTNTHRRAGMAANAINNALHDEAIAKTMHNLADAIESGDAKHLAGVNSKAAVEQLDGVLRNAIYARDNERFNSYAEREKQKGRPAEQADIQHAKYPWAQIRPENEMKLIAALKERRGGKVVADQVRQSNTLTDDLLSKITKVLGEKEAHSQVGWYALAQLKDASRLKRAGINSTDDLHAALSEYLQFRSSKKAEDPVTLAERALVGQKVGFDFFPTPKPLAERMAELAGVKPGDSVLEPSAGNGNLADAARNAGGKVDTLEISHQLRNVLDAKKHNVIGHDFETHDFGDKQYDSVIMNPPFSNRLDAQHIKSAWDRVKPGGKLVAIAGEGVFFGSDKKAQDFREWLDDNNAEVEMLPSGTFQDKTLQATTGVNARLIVMEKPEQQQQSKSNGLNAQNLIDDAWNNAKSGHTRLVKNPKTGEFEELYDDATDDTGPQDGDVNADGLVFRDGRWHRDEQEQVKETPLASADEYHYSKAQSAYQHSSRYGAAAARDEYVRSINSAYEKLNNGLNDEQKKYLDDAFVQLKKDYLEKEKPILSTRSGMVSAHIAGRSNFNSSLATRGQSAHDKAISDHSQWFNGAISDIENGISNRRNDAQKTDDESSAKAKKANAVILDFARQISEMSSPGMDKSAFMKGATRSWRSLIDMGDDVALDSFNKINAALGKNGTSLESVLGKNSNLWKDINGFLQTQGVLENNKQPLQNSNKSLKPRAVVKMTMDEWKRKHKDYKGIENGQRFVLAVDGIYPVEIVKDPAQSSKGQPVEINTPNDKKDQALQAAIDHLETDSKQSDLPAKERGEDKKLVNKLKEAVDKKSTKENDDLNPSSPNYRYRDTGDIAGSRKEKAATMIRHARKTGQQLLFTDIDWEGIEQNPREARELITKSNLFGAVDWAALKAGGMEPGAGFLIDRVYASVAKEPEDSDVFRKDYVLGLETLRSRMEKCKTPEDVTNVLKDIKDEWQGVMMGGEDAAEYQAALAVARGKRTIARDAKKEQDAVYMEWNGLQIDLHSLEREQRKRTDRKWKPDPEIAAKIDELAPKVKAAEAVFRQYQNDHPELQTKRRDLGNGWTNMDNDLEWEATKASQKAETILSRVKAANLMSNPTTRAWFSLGGKFHAVLNYRGYKGSDAFGKHVVTARNGRIKDWSWAEKDSRTIDTGAKGATKKEVQFFLQVADKMERKGGKSITTDSTEALKKTFGLRDVQSGNWVLKDPASAAFHVQKSAEAFSDLGDILGVNTDKLALNGRLALALGARGTGNAGFGGAARAHYEPVQRVINLTKMGGGGCLGHEYFHALDNMVAEMEGGKSGTKDHYVTEDPTLLPPGKVRDAVTQLQKALFDGDTPITTTIKYEAKDIKTAQYNFDRNYVSGLPLKIKNAGDMHQAVQAINDYYGNRTDKKSIKNKSDWTRLAVAYYDNNPEGGEAQVKTGVTWSSFAHQSKRLDGGESGKYWSKPREMAARAFQSYLEDKLESQGRKNDYLSSMADNKYYKDGLFDPVYPFPDGAERSRINAAFDVFVNALRESGTLHKAFGISPATKILFFTRRAA